jgi:hypothetical protein
MNFNYARQENSEVVKLKATIGIVLIFFSLPAWSEDHQPAYYFQGNVGQSFSNSPANSGVIGLDLHGNGNGLGLKVLAGMNFMPMFGAEVGVIDLNSTTVYTPSGPVDYSTTMATLEGTFTYPFNADQTYWLVARAGVGATRTNININTLNYSSTSDQHPFIAGLGLRYTATPTADFVIDYDFLGKTGAFQNGGKLNDALLSAGVRIKF